MSSAGSVTYWIERLKAGDHFAAQKLWECYFQQLVRLALHKLQGLPRRAADEEDVALSAFHSFCQGAEQGRFPQLNDREDLWHLLVVITARKAQDLIVHERRQKRGGATQPGTHDPQAQPDLDEIIGREPTPEFAAQVADECERLLGLLDDPGLRAVAQWKMEGYNTDQIAARLGCVARTVERKLRMIRSRWAKEIKP
jgi:DNA-directed RNA polymerase specialized sigma24 family protein